MLWPALYFVDFLAISWFLISYYLNCYRRGYRIDLWHTNLFLSLVLPNMLLLPFTGSELNRAVLGGDLPSVVAALPFIFMVVMCGYLATLAGGNFWRLKLGMGARKAAYRVLSIIPRCSMMLMSHPRLLIGQALVCISLQVILLGMYFAHDGFGFNLRAYTFANPSIRPVALLVSGSSVIIGAHCLARYVDTKQRILLVCTLLLSFGLIFFGARSSIAAIYLNVLVCHLVRLRNRISLLRIVALLTFLVAVVFYLGNVRQGQYSLSELFGTFVFLLVYGNNFSDFRDFAWVYSKWDHTFWAGRTYLAGITSFIPRFASEFRDTWGLGVVTATTLGFDPQVHPGVRPGNFGEGFFNFGFLGVVAVGLLTGILVRRVDTDVKRAFTIERPSMMKAFAATSLLNVAACVAISVNLSALYVLCLVFAFSWVCICVGRLFRQHS